MNSASSTHTPAGQRAPRPTTVRPDPGGVGPADIISALPDIALAGAFLLTWISSYRLGERMVAHLVLIMLMEFIVVHSAAFMGTVAVSGESKWRKVALIVGLSIFYSVFAGGFSWAFRDWFPLLAFWGLTLNRLAGVIVGQAPEGRERMLVQKGWAASAILYLLGAGLTAFLPLPALGSRRK